MEHSAPLVGIVTRLVGHKGVDLMREVLEKSLWERDKERLKALLKSISAD